MADDPFENVLVHLRVQKRRGDRAECYCPAHPDDRASLSVARGIDQAVVLHCHAGCDTDAVLASIGLSMNALMGGEPHVVAVYTYVDALGAPLYSVERWVPKTFRPRLTDGTYARPPAGEEVLYRLPELLAAKAAGQPIYLVEGERDVETARQFGLVATTAMSGASQPWLPQFTDQLSDARLVIVADNDDAGRRRARMLKDELWPYVSSCRAVVPRLGKDLSDHLWAGFSEGLLDPLPAEGTLLVYKLSQVVAAPITWAWSGWVPTGVLCLVEGDPGDGKSVLTCDLAARWTTGAAMPDGTPNPFGRGVNVGMCSAEDDPARVIRPRVELAGGDLDRLSYVAGMPLVGGRYSRSIDLSADIDALREAIEADNLRVLILDPLMAFVGATRTAIDSEVRNMLTPLKHLAEETDCTILAVRHLRKAGGKAVHSGGGSIAFTGAARSVLMVGRSPRDNDVRVLAVTKMNLALTPSSLSYLVESGPGSAAAYPRLNWRGEIELSSDDLMAAATSRDERETYRELADAVTELLAREEMEFPALRKKLLAAGVEHSEKTLRSVLKLVAIKRTHNRGTTGFKITYSVRAEESGNVPPANPDPEVNGNPQVKVTPSNQAPGPGETLSPEGWDSSTEKSESDSQPAKPVDNPPPDRQVDLDLEVACQVCQSPDGLKYVKALRGWRCLEHLPEDEP